MGAADEPDFDPAMPLPIVEVNAAEAVPAHFSESGGQATPETPLGTAMLWFLACEDPVANRRALEFLSDNPAAWGDYGVPAETLAGKSILSRVRFADNRDDLAYVLFIKYAGAQSGRVVGEALMKDVDVLTLVQVDGLWLVWGMSRDYYPPAEQVFP